MSIFGPHTGDSNRHSNYLYGSHWNNKAGYNIKEGEDAYTHVFGGNSWNLPICNICNETIHQIITLDLNDPRLESLKSDDIIELPLVSCLNCANIWDEQVYKINSKDKSIVFLSQKNTESWNQLDEDKIMVPMPEKRMKLIDVCKDEVPTNENNYYRAMDALGIDYICRILGAPLLAEGPIDLQCPICGKEMLCIATLVEDNYTENSRCIADCNFHFGEIFLYFALCKDCNVIKTQYQGT